MNIGDIFTIEQYDEAYKFVSENEGTTIQEAESKLEEVEKTRTVTVMEQQGDVEVPVEKEETYTEQELVRYYQIVELPKPTLDELKLAKRAEINQARDEANNVAGSTGNYDKETVGAGDITITVTYNGETKTEDVTLGAKDDGGTAATKIQTALQAMEFGDDSTQLGANFTVTFADGAFKVASANGEELKISFEVGGAKMDATAGNATRVESVDRFNAILDQIDQLAKDSGYKGVNLLGGTDQSLTVIFNEDRSSNLVIQGVDASANGLSISRVSDWGSNTNIDASITQVEDAINELRNMASEFGNNYSVVQTREDFTDNLINVLEEGSDKLVLADMNEESANMLALQTRQQLAVNSLSLASQAAQSVLKLF